MSLPAASVAKRSPAPCRSNLPAASFDRNNVTDYGALNGIVSQACVASRDNLRRVCAASRDHSMGAETVRTARKRYLPAPRTRGHRRRNNQGVAVHDIRLHAAPVRQKTHVVSAREKLFAERGKCTRILA
jgi:hypothetical protein